MVLLLYCASVALLLLTEHLLRSLFQLLDPRDVAADLEALLRVLDLGLDALGGVRGLNVQGDGLAGEVPDHAKSPTDRFS